MASEDTFDTDLKEKCRKSTREVVENVTHLGSVSYYKEKVQAEELLLEKLLAERRETQDRAIRLSRDIRNTKRRIAYNKKRLEAEIHQTHPSLLEGAASGSADGPYQSGSTAQEEESEKAFQEWCLANPDEDGF